MILPICFLLANLTRGYFANPLFFGKKPFQSLGINWFEYLGKKQYLLFILWILISVAYFWTTAYLMIKLKSYFYPFKTETQKVQLNLIPKTECSFQKEIKTDEKLLAL